MTLTLTDQDLDDRATDVLRFIVAEASRGLPSAPVRVADAASMTWLFALRVALEEPEAWARLVAMQDTEDAETPRDLARWMAGRSVSGELGEYLSSVVAERDLMAEG